MRIYRVGFPSLAAYQFWRYAKINNLVIVSKDTDFSALMMTSEPPPRVVHIRIGNMRIATLTEFLQRMWPTIEAELADHKLVNVYVDRIEAVASNA
jgi:predicted nuclease of predicted toxin-antitoxin system